MIHLADGYGAACGAEGPTTIADRTMVTCPACLEVVAARGAVGDLLGDWLTGGLACPDNVVSLDTYRETRKRTGPKPGPPSR